MNLSEKLDALKRAGFAISWADPAEAYERGYVSYDHAERHAVYRDEADRPFVDFGIRDECAYGQSTTSERSNYRSLVRDFGLAFVPVSFTNVNSLGGFPHSMSDDAIETVIALVEQYPVYDESDLSDLEHEEMQASWGQYLWSDVYSELSEEWQQVADLFAESELLGQHEIRDAFYEELHASDYYPDHSGLEVMWDDDVVQDLVIRALCKLVAEHYGPVLPAGQMTLV